VTVTEPSPGEPVGSEPAGTPSAEARRTGGRTLRVSAFAILVLAFLLLAGAAAAAAWGQFKPGETGPVVSIGLSAASVLCTLVAIWLRPKR
jgi:hypothetical protein